MNASIVVWITAQDGSVHATRPPIMAAGQSMLCGRPYGRRDLRIRIQAAAGEAPAGACASCGDLARAAPDATEPVIERRPPLWP